MNLYTSASPGPDSVSNGRNTVVIIGGKGGLEARYREAIEACGYNFRYYEDRVPSKLAKAAGRVALVIVMVSMVSHPLMNRARELAGEHARILYLRSPSLSAVRQTVASQSRTLLLCLGGTSGPQAGTDRRLEPLLCSHLSPASSTDETRCQRAIALLATSQLG